MLHDEDQIELNLTPWTVTLDAGRRSLGAGSDRA